MKAGKTLCISERQEVLRKRVWFTEKVEVKEISKPVTSDNSVGKIAWSEPLNLLYQAGFSMVVVSH